MKNRIYPCLWFDGQAQPAAQFYCSIFKNSRVTADNQMVVTFELNGEKFMGLNGGPQFQINSSISFFVICRTEEETQSLWTKLSPDSKVLIPLDAYDWSPKYGWLQDKFGVSWQFMLEQPAYTQQNIVPLFFFTGKNHGKAEAAVRFYLSVFKNTKSHGILKYTDEDNNTYANGKVKHAQFELEEQTFMAMDSGVENDIPFTEAISMVVDCETQEEIDYYWDKLTADGGEESNCGWLKDKFGVSWQIVPTVLPKLLSDPNRAQNVTEAFMKMKKFDIETLENA